VSKALVFDDTQRSVERLSKELQARGFMADAIHGGKSQGQRQRALKRFKSSEVNVLVATDVAARGIDVSDISHVINYSTPQSYDDYVHRVGRAGRAGKTGFALTFIEA
jgi:superfamily II DNA/RNA helicase